MLDHVEVPFRWRVLPHIGDAIRVNEPRRMMQCQMRKELDGSKWWKTVRGVSGQVDDEQVPEFYT